MNIINSLFLASLQVKQSVSAGPVHVPVKLKNIFIFLLIF